VKAISDKQKAKTVKEYKDRARFDIKRLKEKGMSHSDYENLLQVEINKIVRLIDRGVNCISCFRPISQVGYKATGKPQASHRFSVGSNNSLRFSLLINHCACYRCNVMLSGNPDGYDEGLRTMYGQEYFELVHDQKRLYPIVKLPSDDLKDKIGIAREIVKELKSVELVFSAAERIEYRKFYNKQIGIYNL